MKKIFLSSFTIFTLLLASCSKGDFTIDLNGGGGWGGWGMPVFNISSFDTSALGYVRLPLKRYYIYKDQSTGFTDSVVVTQSNDSSAFLPALPGYSIGFVSYIYKLTLTGFTGSSSQIWYSGTSTSDFPPGIGTASTPVTIIDSNFTLSGGSGSLPTFWCPFNSAGVGQYSYIPSLTIEGITYTGVHVFNTSNGLLPTNPNYTSTEFCWVKGIGIIKKEIRTFNSVKTSLLVRFG